MGDVFLFTCINNILIFIFYIDFGGYDNKTYYIGRSNNRIKIYNKKLESNLDYDLTRVEITSKIDLEYKASDKR